METNESIAAWFAGRLPEAWYVEPATVSVDREEILVVGRIPSPGDAAADRAAAEGRIARFREETRQQRMEIAEEAQARYRRTVSWGATCGAEHQLFTHVAAPVMTRLRQPERRVLDVLVESGVARSRSEAVAWCVRLVGEHEGDWITSLQDALAAVRDARAQGPGRRRTS